MLNLSSWVPIGPAPIHTQGSIGPISGRVEGVATHPSNPSVLCAAPAGGGVWITSDAWPGPPSWSPRTDQQSSLAFNGYRPLAIHPNKPNLVVGVACGTGGGLLKSTNGGTTWELLANGPLAGPGFGTIALDPTDEQVMYVCAGQAGAFKSGDGGASWGTGPLPLPSGFVWDLILDPGDPSAKTLYAAVLQAGSASNNGIYKSTTGGASWVPVNAGFQPAPSWTAASAVRLEAGPGFIYVAILTDPVPQTDPPSATIARYRIPTSGGTWTLLNPTPGPTEWRAWHLLLGVDPKDANHVFVNDAYSLYETTDGGGHWMHVDAGQGWLSNGNSFDWVNIAFDSAGDAILTADQGVFRYQPKTNAWASLVGNLQVSQLYTLALDPNDAGTVYAVGQDLNTVKTAGIPVWSTVESAPGEMGKLIVDPSNSQRVHGFNPLGPSHLVMRSLDGGKQWTTVFATTEFPSQDYTVAGQIQYSFVMDPNDPDRLLFGTSRVFETQNASAPSPTYAAMSGVLSPNQQICSLAIAPSNGSWIYAATTDGHVWRTENGGTNWQAVDGGVSGAAHPASDLTIDPSLPDHVFAVTEDGLWELSPGSSTWEKVAGAILPRQKAMTVYVDWTASPPALYVGSDRGVLVSFVNGAAWTNFGLGLPHTTINRLVGGMVGPSGTEVHVLAAATLGRGAWEILLPAPSEQVAYLDAEGHVRALYTHNGAHWQQVDLSAMSAATPAAKGSRLTGYPWPAMNSKQVCYLDGAGLINELSIVPGHDWFHANLSAKTSAPPAKTGSDLSGYPWTAGNSKQVAYLESGGHVHELFIVAGANWIHADLSKTTNATPAAPDSALAGFAWDRGRSKQVVYQGLDGHVHELSVVASTNWQVNDLTKITGATGAAVPAPGSSLSGYQWALGRSKQVVYLDGNGHVHELYFVSGGKWGHADLSMITGAPPTAPGSALVGYEWSAGRSKQVVYLDGNGHIHELYFVHGWLSWKHADLTKATGAPSAASGTALTAYDWISGNSKQVMYLDASGHVHQLRIVAGGNWSHTDLTAATGAAPAIAGSALTGYECHTS